MSAIYKSQSVLVSLQQQGLAMTAQLRRSATPHAPTIRTMVSSSKSRRPFLRRQASGARPRLDTTGVTEIIGPYGLRRVDYSKPPPRWPRPPPPPASKQATERYFPFILAALTLFGGVWIYFNQDEQVYDYWKQVETGNVPLDGINDDDDDMDDDEDEWEVRE